MNCPCGSGCKCATQSQSGRCACGSSCKCAANKK
ncbi:metallothionein-1-like [Zeugodacus cucurbitae]|nr:metallothionein-1-like [Zeugodacus cucurbitae]